jgi:hypothetical protein
MRTIRLVLPGAALARRRAAPAARAAAPLALGLGADYLVKPEVGEFQLTLALEKHLARSLTAGVRLGALVTGDDDTKVGVPIDFRLRLRTHRIYVDGLVGPWFIFDSGDTLRFHGALGFGFLLSGGVSLGAEVGVLDRTGIIGVRLAFSI